MFNIFFDLQLFAAGDLVNATTHYVNADTGSVTAFDGTNTLSPGMKTYYDTELLENARANLYFEQFGRKQNLPANRGRTMEWRKWNTLPRANVLQEGVIPSGQKMGQTMLTATLEQYGMFVAITDLLDLHHIDDVLLGATEELGASAGETKDILIRNVLQAGTSVMFCDNVAADGTKTQVSEYAGMSSDNCRLTPDMVAKAATHLKKMNAPTIGGKYVAIIHPYVAYDLMRDPEWIDAHKYAKPDNLYEGEIGEVAGVRFVQTSEAKIYEGGVFGTLVFGEGAYGVTEITGGGLQTIVKQKGSAGTADPLDQRSSVGWKAIKTAELLIPQYLVRVESKSATFSDTATAN